MSSLTRRAGWSYAAATIALAAAAARLVFDAARSPRSTLQLHHKLLGLALVVSSLFSQMYFGGWYSYLRKMDKNGCDLAPLYPNDPTGLNFLRHAIKHLKMHSLLQLRQENTRTLGPTFMSRNLLKNQLTITTVEPENVKTILSSKFDDWAIPQTRISGFLPVFGHHSIFSVNGPEWQHSRAMLRPAFVRDQISDMACLDLHISKFIKRIPADGSRFDIQALFSMLTIDSITDFMFGQSTDMLGSAPPDGVKFGQCFDESMLKVGHRARLGWIRNLVPDRQLDEDTKFMKAYVERFIEEVRQKNIDKASSDRDKYVFLNELIKSNEPNDVIRDQIFAVFIAGRDTTTSALTYLFYEFSRRPDVVEKIQTEIRELGVENPSWDQLKNMKYLQWTIKEALRLHPPVPTNSRQAVRDTVLPCGGGPDGKSPLFVPKGWNCVYHTWILHRRPELYGPDAEEFRPERWDNLRVTWEYLPWNGGPRICIGQQFATTQIALVTYRLLTAFKSIERRDDRPAQFKLGINISFVNGCWVSMTPA